MSFNTFGNVVLDPNSKQNTSLDRSRNGIPIVNISTPNNHGVSVNNFLEYNVGKEGQVLNNADNIGRSHLAGIINANPNLGPHQAANLVILQVNGANRSQIEGYIEALSRERVNVILSNENGIYLDGAGTINIRNFIPTTGKVNLFDGQYVGIDVGKGQAVIGANGFNGKDTDYVGIITKALELQGSIVANELDVITGENKVDSKGNITSKGGVNSVAIDAYNLGSMYAGQVKIIATDRGAGVNSSSLIYSKDKKLEITADGKVRVATIKGQGIDIKASEYEQTELSSSDKDININASKISLQGETQANEDINLAGNVVNSSDIYTNKNLNTKDLSNSGNINVSNLTNIDGKLDNKGSLESIGSITTGNISNKGEILTSGSLKGDDLVNDGKVSVRNDIGVKSTINTKQIVSGKGIETGTTKNSGDILTAGKLDIKGNADNIGTLEAQDIRVKGDTFSNKGNVSSDNISVEVKDTKNDGKILSSNDIELKTKTLENTKEILAVKDIKLDNVDLTNVGEIASNNKISLNNTNTKNRGKIVSNGEVQLNNSSIINSGEILSDKVEMKDNKNYTNTGSIKGNKTTLTTTKDIDLVGELHGEENLTIKGNNISNNGRTTGKGTIDISSNDFVNNREISSDTVLINGQREITNNSIITGNNGKVSGRNITNNDLIATERNLELNAQNRVLNNKGSAVYGGDSLKIKGQEILNDEAEILGGDMDLNVTRVINNVATIQSTGDVNITSKEFQNIGRVSNLRNYEKYYETWDGVRLSEEEMKNYWLYHGGNNWDKSSSGNRGNQARREQREWLEKFIRDNQNNPKVNSLILTRYEEEARKSIDNGYKRLESSTARFPETSLKGKLESKADTEYGKVIADGNITINSNEVINKDSIISSGQKALIKADTLEHSITIGNPVQLQDGKEKLELEIRRYRRRGRGRVKMVAYFDRELVNGDIGYEAGRPSVIEGRVAEVDVPNIKKSTIEAANGLILENGGTTGKGLISGNMPSINKGTGNYSTGIQIVGNTKGIEDIKNSGVININPILNSAMFTTNLDPSSKYLLETRSEYINLNRYFGSDYFLTRVSYKEDWNRVKRLGDAYYENQLITRALNEKLGTAFLNNLSGQELIQSMIDNASEEQKRLGLEVGKELTKEQIANLQDDIIWYVETEVNGLKVLSPQVYLSSKSRNNLDTDTRNRIGGTEGTYVKTKEYNLEGIKVGNSGLSFIEAETVRNETVNNLLSEIKGDTTVVKAKGNIENIGGLISGTEDVYLISEKGDVINDTTKRTVGYNNGEYNRTYHEEIASIGGITSPNTHIKANSYQSTGGVLRTDNLHLEVNGLDIRGLSLSGADSFGTGSKDYNRYGETVHLGGVVEANRTTGRIGDINLEGSSFIGGDTKGLTITGDITASSQVNSYDIESQKTSESMLKKNSQYINSHIEENSASNLQLSGANIQVNITGIGSNIDLGENTYVGGKITTDSRELNNRYYEENKSSGISGSIGRGGVSVGYGRSRDTYDEKSLINAKSNLYIGDGSTLNQGAEITATNFVHGDISINNGDVLYGARKDTQDIHTTSKSSWIGVSVSINSPAVDRIRQATNAVNDIRRGNTANGLLNLGNAYTGTVVGLAGNQGNRLETNNGQSRTKEEVDRAKANNDFYLNFSANIGYNTSKNETNSHTERAVVTTITGLNPNSTITYNNVNNITYQGTQARDTSAVSNNVETIRKEAVELNNSYSSSSRSSGIGIGTNMSLSPDLNKGITKGGSQYTANNITGSINISSGRSNMKTEETVYANGNFTNVNEVHNNTKNMTLRGFNQEGGQVSGSIENLEIISLQNTSKTTGSSRGINVGIPIGAGSPSLNVSGGRTSGNREFVDNQSTFIVGDGSNLTVGRTENTGGIIGTTGNGKIEIQEYVGNDIYNSDNYRSTEISLGSTGVGGRYQSNDKQGITRNTVVGNVEIGSSTGAPINTDLSKANEITKDKSRDTGELYAESQLIGAIVKPQEFLDKQDRALQELKDIGTAIRNTINKKGAEDRNFIEILNEQRRATTINNILGSDVENINRAYKKKEISNEEYQNGLKRIIENFTNDMGMQVDIVYVNKENMPKGDSGNKGVAYIDGETGVMTIPINTSSITSTSELIGTVFEEVSHLIDATAGRTKKTEETAVAGEQGLESLGRPVNEYFQEQYKKDDTPINLKDSGRDLTNANLGTKVGEDIISVHGGARAKASDVDGPRLKYQEKGLLKNEPKKELEFAYNLGIQLYTDEGVKAVSVYRHREDSAIIVWGHSLGADSTLEAYAVGYKEKVERFGAYSRSYMEETGKIIRPERADELNIVMPRIDFIEKYLNNASKNAASINLFVLKGDKELKAIQDYGDRSYETLQNKIKNGEITVPKNVRVIAVDPVNKTDHRFNPDYTINNHALALDYGNPMFENIWRSYEGSGSKYAK